ncbi:MAG TPA: aminotransferase class I/II-fold pyridoxal phosphate-dependent enzyme, partial [Bdellovibrionales bacterium]|nr:aminotransferase class I/II-fold pyridoxal phosphate-dependent enzyme [Bdellovibrionales bacterium]
FNTTGDKVAVGLSTVDGRVPVDGALSRHLTETIGDETNAYEYELNSEKFSLADFRENSENNVDLFSKAQKYGVFFRDWEKSDRYGNNNVRLASMGPRVNLKRKRKNGRNDYLIMGSNDYLGFSSHPEVLKAAKDAIDKYGFGSTGSPLTTGISDIHEQLSALLAQMFHKEKVILFNSGYAANLGTIAGLIQAQDLVVSDMIAHASIQDGMKMAQGASRFFKHNNVQHLDGLLEEHRKDYAGSLVVTEGVFSMDGDVAPLDEIVKVARKHKSRIMVDEAHSFGVIGATGLGGCEKYDVLDQVDIVMGTFSKISGSIGGFIATSNDVADWLYWLARSHMFSVSIPPSTAAATLKSLEIFNRDKSILQSLQANIKHFSNGLRSLGFDISQNHESAVLPAVIGDQEKLGIMNKHLMDAGVFVVPVPYPAVSRTKIRFRFTVIASHTTSDLDYALNVLESAMEKADFRPQKQGDKPKAA